MLDSVDCCGKMSSFFGVLHADFAVVSHSTSPEFSVGEECFIFLAGKAEEQSCGEAVGLASASAEPSPKMRIICSRCILSSSPLALFGVEVTGDD